MAENFEHIQVSKQGEVLVLNVLLEEVTKYEVAQAMEHELTNAVDQNPAKAVLVDLGNVEFMSSVGYLPYVGVRSHVHDAGGRLILCNLSEIIREMFDSARLLINRKSPKAPFEYADSVEAGLQMVTE